MNRYTLLVFTAALIGYSNLANALNNSLRVNGLDLKRKTKIEFSISPNIDSKNIGITLSVIISNTSKSGYLYVPYAGISGESFGTRFRLLNSKRNEIAQYGYKPRYDSGPAYDFERKLKLGAEESHEFRVDLKQLLGKIELDAKETYYLVAEISYFTDKSSEIQSLTTKTLSFSISDFEKSVGL